jgi:hypothetical protein
MVKNDPDEDAHMKETTTSTASPTTNAMAYLRIGSAYAGRSG